MSEERANSSKSIVYGEGKQALIDAAVRVVARGGLRALTYRSVAAEAGVANGLVRHYFGKKDALLKAALESVISDSIRRSELAPASAGITELAARLTRSVSEQPENEIFQYELIVQSTRQPELKPAVKELYREYTEAASQALHQSGLGEDSDLIYLVNAALDGLVFEQLALNDPAQTERAIEKLRQLLTAYRASNS